ncbi:MAG: DUF3106 domain-containing protein [Bryobacteraceae bacterium]|nr:DUF3106 domain-containing protein [Bryobacteraceae bacterium]
MARRLILVVLAGVLAIPLSAQPRRARLRQPISPQAIERWQRLTPEERQRALDRLPPERRRMIEERLREYNSLSDEERERLADRYEEFRKLPPREQREMRRLFQTFRDLPPARRRVVRMEVEFLRGMAPEQRRARLAGDSFRERFSADEQKLITGLAGRTPPPD